MGGVLAWDLFPRLGAVSITCFAVWFILIAKAWKELAQTVNIGNNATRTMAKLFQVAQTQDDTISHLAKNN
jgi:hypothetical protein